VSLNAVLLDVEDSKYGMFRSKKPMATERERERERGFMVLVFNIFDFQNFITACMR